MATLTLKPFTTATDILSIETVARISEKVNPNTTGDSLTTTDFDYDLFSYSIYYYNPATADDGSGGSAFVPLPDFRGDSSTDITAAANFPINESRTAAILIKTGATLMSYITSCKIQNVTAANLKWLDGTVPSAGNVNSVDMYVFNIVRTSVSATTQADFHVFASQHKFA